MGDDVEQLQPAPPTGVRTVVADRAVTSLFQPIVELDSGRVVAYEALARGAGGNECHLTPVADAPGTVVQYIGIQTDVTDRVTAERALVTEQDRRRSYAARLAELDDRLAGGARSQTSMDSPGARRA
ncbi:hypothetical protein [Modestobacter italicus]|uniref:hypothetical protein n=1 Tax=Modestobacter italicus (strain DSM 44449 / CECT 9708 / BC 501) TaxID=2732864 RepID=UPI001C9553F4|nr:hypothetical protein [Modestobacter italicus]